MYTTDVKVADGASAAVRKVKLARTLMRCTALSRGRALQRSTGELKEQQARLRWRLQSESFLTFL